MWGLAGNLNFSEDNMKQFQSSILGRLGGLLALLVFAAGMLICRAQLLINVDFGVETSPKVGPGAYGLTGSDFWNAHLTGVDVVTVPNLRGADGALTGTGLILSNAYSHHGIAGVDRMLGTYTSPRFGSTTTIIVTNLMAGFYDFYLYGHGEADGQVTTFQLSHGGVDHGSKTVQPSFEWRRPQLIANIHYVIFTVQVVTGAPVIITASGGFPGGLACLNGMQIVETCGLLAPPIPPASQVVTLGEQVTFSTAATGVNPVRYQWQFAGTNIAGATSGTLTFAATNEAQAGVYSAVISSGDCSKTVSASLNFKTKAPNLWNIDFGRGVVKTGYAATGQSDEDQWNSVATATPPEGVLLRTADGRITPVRLTMTNGVSQLNNQAPDPMFASYLEPLSANESISVTLTNLLPGLYDLYLYGHGAQGNTVQNSAFEVSVARGIRYGRLATERSPLWDSAAWREGVQYVVLRNLIIGGGGALTIVVTGDGQAPGALNGLQIVDHNGLVVDDRLMTQTVIPGQPVTLSVSAKSETPVNYKWRLGPMVIPDATNASYTIPAASLDQTARYSVTVDNDLNITPSHAILIFRTITVSRSQELMLQGAAQSRWRVEYTDALGNPANWHVLTNLTLPASPHLFVDPTAANQPRRFYRAIPAP